MPLPNLILLCIGAAGMIVVMIGLVRSGSKPRK